MTKRFLLIAGGELDFAFAGEYLSAHSFDFVACADAGLEAAERLGLSVDYIMGDFDSVSAEVLDRYRNHSAADGRQAQVVRYPAEKDATDLHLLLDWAVGQQPEEIVILGASGGRLDHFLANVNILMGALAAGVPAYIVDRQNKLYLLSHRREFHRQQMHGKYISFLPLTEKVRGVSLQGFRYELNGRDMVLGDSLGVSNEIAEGCETAVADFAEGILIAVESAD